MKILPKRISGFSISAIIIFIILAIGTVYLNGIKNSYSREIVKISESIFSLDSKAAKIEVTKQERINFIKKRFFLDFPVKYSFSLANYLRQLSLITSEQIQLTEIEITPKGEGFYFLLKGFVIERNNIRAQSKFLSFFKRLKNFENIFQINSSKVKVDPSQKGEKHSYTGNKVSGKDSSASFKLYFTISGDYEL